MKDVQEEERQEIGEKRREGEMEGLLTHSPVPLLMTEMFSGISNTRRAAHEVNRKAELG